MIKLVLTFLILLHIFSACEAQTLGVQQTLNKFIAASPEASAIATYQNCPVDYITGTPQITIPLMEIDTKLGKIPFEISYHIGRIKPSELTGPIGFGWTMTPNLGISRSVKGAPDGINSGYVAPNPDFGNYSNCMYLLNLSRNNFFDEQPDDFYYSLLNKSGRFIYKRDGSFTTIPFEPIRITRTSNESFIIIDVDGTTYKFGRYSSGATTCLEYTQTNVPLLTSWKVTEIISYDKTDTIKFVYNNLIKKFMIPFYNQQWKVIEYPASSTLHTTIHRTNFLPASSTFGWEAMRPNEVTTIPTPDPLTVYDVNSNTGYSGGSVWPLSSFSTSPGCNLDYGQDYAEPTMVTEHIIDEVFLTDVIFRGGKISLSYDATQLSSITLYAFSNQQYVQVKKVSLYQHKVYAAYGSNPFPYYDNINFRHLLDSVQYKGSDEATQQTCKAAYTNGDGMLVAGNWRVDMFGYHNGMGYNSVPALPLDFAYLFCQANPGDPNASGTAVAVNGIINIGSKRFYGGSNFSTYQIPPGILQKITLPTGGTEEFEFEQNVFKIREESEAVKGAGFRIKNIKYKTGAGTESLIKDYKYGLNENGLGNIRYIPNAADFISQQIVNTTSLSNTSNTVQKITTVNSTPFKDMAFDNGAAVLYPLVTEYTQSPAGNLGKTTHAYDIDGLDNVRLPNTPLQYDYRDDWKRSSLSCVTNYRFKNNIYEPVQKTAYSYTNFITDIVPVASAFQQQVSQTPASNEDQLICSNGGNVSFLSYNLLPGAKKLQQQKETFYDSEDINKFIEVTKNYGYDPATLLQISQTEVNSKNELKQTNNWYPDNVSQLPDWPPSQMPLVSSLQSGNRINIPIKQKSFINSNPLVTIQNYFSYADNGQIYPSETWASILNKPLENKIKINKYDSYGNVLDQQKPGDVHEVYLWGYNGRYVVAKIIGSDYTTASQYIDQSVLDNSATTDAAMLIELNQLRIALPKAIINTYTFKPLVGMTSQTDANNKTTYYEYDHAGRLQYMRDQNHYVIKKICYNYAGQAENCFGVGNTNMDGNYYSQNCAAGQSPAPYFVSVPAGMFFAASPEVANQQAQAYAQNQANQYGTCYTSLVSLPCNNTAGYSYTVQLTNVSTGQSYSFQSYAYTNTVIGSVPAGTYDIILSSGNPYYQTYSVGCGYYYNTSDYNVRFSYVPISSSCNAISIN